MWISAENKKVISKKNYFYDLDMFQLSILQIVVLSKNSSTFLIVYVVKLEAYRILE